MNMIRKDTEYSPREQRILGVFLRNEHLSSSELHTKLLETGEDLSLVTVKRALSLMASRGLLVASGGGRSFSYAISVAGRIFSAIDAHAYCALEPDKRFGMNRYNLDLFARFPDDAFTVRERARLDEATTTYLRRIEHLPPAIEKKELERLIIELSWKSSRIMTHFSSASALTKRGISTSTTIGAPPSPRSESPMVGQALRKASSR